MKDVTREQASLFDLQNDEAYKRITVALDFLWEDNTKSIHDKMAGDFDYGELIATLLCAQSKITQLEEERDCLEDDLLKSQEEIRRYS